MTVNISQTWHISPNISGGSFLFKTWIKQTIGRIVNLRSHPPVGTLRHLITIIMQGFLKVFTVQYVCYVYSVQCALKIRSIRAIIFYSIHCGYLLSDNPFFFLWIRNIDTSYYYNSNSIWIYKHIYIYSNNLNMIHSPLFTVRWSWTNSLSCMFWYGLHQHRLTINCHIHLSQ